MEEVAEAEEVAEVAEVAVAEVAETQDQNCGSVVDVDLCAMSNARNVCSQAEVHASSFSSGVVELCSGKTKQFWESRISSGTTNAPVLELSLCLDTERFADNVTLLSSVVTADRTSTRDGSLLALTDFLPTSPSSSLPYVIPPRQLPPVVPCISTAVTSSPSLLPNSSISALSVRTRFGISDKISLHKGKLVVMLDEFRSWWIGEVSAHIQNRASLGVWFSGVAYTCSRRTSLI